MPAEPAGSGLRYRERLTVPISWWVLSALFALSLLLAFGFYLGPVWGLGSALVSFAAMAAVFAAAGSEITVDSRRLRVGRASIELGYLADVAPLDAATSRRRRGPDADARAFLVLRPYIPTAVEITLADPDDPAPYWLVASRRPKAFATAVAEAVAGQAAAARG